MDDFEQRSAHPGRRLRAEQAAHRGADVPDDAVRAHHHDQVAAVLDERAEVLFAPAQAHLALLDLPAIALDAVRDEDGDQPGGEHRAAGWTERRLEGCPGTRIIIPGEEDGAN